MSDLDNLDHGPRVYYDKRVPVVNYEHDGHTIDIGHVHVLNDDRTCRDDCPHPDHDDAADDNLDGLAHDLRTGILNDGLAHLDGVANDYLDVPDNDDDRPWVLHYDTFTLVRRADFDNLIHAADDFARHWATTIGAGNNSAARIHAAVCALIAGAAAQRPAPDLLTRQGEQP